MRHLILAGFALLTWPAAAATEEAGLGTAMLHRPMDAWAPAPVVLLAPGPSLWDPMAARLREALLAGGLAVLEPLTEEPDLLALEPDLRHHPRLDPARIAVLELGPEGLRAHLWLGCGDLRATLVAGGEATTPRQPGCEAARRGWLATGARVWRHDDPARPRPSPLLPAADGAGRILVEVWAGPAAFSPGEAAGLLRRALSP